MSQSVLAHRVVARYLAKVDDRALAQFLASRDLEAFEFPTWDSLKNYLKDHPNADKAKHKVVKHDPAKAKKLHEKHVNSGPAVTEQAVHLNHAAKGVANKITEGGATKADLAPLKEPHNKLVGRAGDVEKDIAAFVKEHEGTDTLKDWGHSVSRSLADVKSKFEKVEKAGEKGFDRQDARTVKELGDAAQELAAHIGNAVKEMKRLGE